MARKTAIYPDGSVNIIIADDDFDPENCTIRDWQEGDEVVQAPEQPE